LQCNIRGRNRRGFRVATAARIAAEQQAVEFQQGGIAGKDQSQHPTEEDLMNRIMLAFCATLIAVSSQAFGQSAPAWPSKTTRFITNYAPGGPTDLAARTVAGKMQQLTGQPFVVENLPSANGVVGTQATARAAPDGHTLMLSTAGHTALAAALFSDRLPFDPFRDIAPVSMLVISNQILVANADLGVRTVADLVKLAKSKPGQLNYATPGIGTPNHLGMELLNSMAGIKTVHVPYKGTAAMLQDLLAGRVQVMINSVATLVPHIKSGKIVPLASGWITRPHALPDLPTMEELGYKDYQVSTWYALFTTGKTPPAVVARISTLTNQIMADPQVGKSLSGAGFDPGGSTPEAVTKLMREEYDRWKKVVTEAKIVVE